MRKINAFYRMLIVFSSVAILAKLTGFLNEWTEVPLWIMVLVFFFAGISHFTSLKFEFVKMIPPKIPGKLFLVYLTGAVEIVGAIDLVHPVTRPYASWFLIAFLVAVFPANYYAAKNQISFRGARPLSVFQRGVVQVAFILALYVGGIL